MYLLFCCQGGRGDHWPSGPHTGPISNTVTSTIVISPWAKCVFSQAGVLSSLSGPAAGSAVGLDGPIPHSTVIQSIEASSIFLARWRPSKTLGRPHREATSHPQAQMHGTCDPDPSPKLERLRFCGPPSVRMTEGDFGSGRASAVASQDRGVEPGAWNRALGGRSQAANNLLLPGQIWGQTRCRVEDGAVKTSIEGTARHAPSTSFRPSSQTGTDDS